MIALFFIGAMTSVAFVSFTSLHKRNEIEQFLELLTMDLYYAHQLAMTTGIVTDVRINNYEHIYSIRQNERIVLEQSFPHHIKFESGTLRLNEIAFNHKGNIRRAGTILIRAGGELYRLVFTLGKGRFYIEKI